MLYVATLLLALAAGPNQGVWEVRGTSANDNILITNNAQSITVTVNGIPAGTLPWTYQGFDEKLYLKLYPGVAAAIERGEFGSGRHHYAQHGRDEGRWRAFDEKWYLNTYTDVAAAVRSGQFASGREHFLSFGFKESRIPCGPSTGVHTVVIRGGDGNDRIEATGNVPTVMYGERGNDGLLGSEGPDAMIGGEGRDNMLSRNGDDYLRGGPGRDELKAYGEGSKTVVGSDEDQIILKRGRFIQE